MAKKIRPEILPDRAAERVTVASVVVLFGCILALFVVIVVLIIVLVQERHQHNLMGHINAPFRSQIYVPMNETNRMFTGYEDVDFVCISMAHRKESHYEALHRDLEKEGIQLTWFKGINGKKLKLDDYNLAPRYRKFFENNLKEFLEGRTTTDYRGHLGCTVSHLNVISNIKNMTVIFEDDTKIVPDFRTKFQAALGAVTRVDPEWELLLLGFTANYNDHHYHKLNDREPIHEGGIVKLHYWIGGWAYCIRSVKVAQKIMEFFNPMTWHIDLSLAEQARIGNLKAYGCMPTLSNHQGMLRISSFDFYQFGDAAGLKSDTNGSIPDDVD